MVMRMSCAIAPARSTRSARDEKTYRAPQRTYRVLHTVHGTIQLLPTLTSLLDPGHPRVHPLGFLADQPVDGGGELAALQPSGIPVVQGQGVHILPDRAELVQAPQVSSVPGDGCKKRKVVTPDVRRATEAKASFSRRRSRARKCAPKPSDGPERPTGRGHQAGCTAQISLSRTAAVPGDEDCAVVRHDWGKVRDHAGQIGR
jgi:hypothetical protein